MDKVTGRVIAEAVATTSYGYGRRDRFPVQSLLLTLDNQITYNIPLNDSDWDIQNHFYAGNKVTVYNASLLYKLLSLDFLYHGERVAQVELNGKVLYSFENRKQSYQTFMWFCLAAAVTFAVHYTFGIEHRFPEENLPQNPITD